MKILIAEDEFLCRENLKRIEWASIGAELVGIAEDGDSAYELAKKLRPDLIISDIMMPNRNGLELAESLTNILPDTKFIILTAYTNFEYAKESISLGIYEYILKPFEDETLLRAAEGALKKLEQEKQLEAQLENISHQLESSRYFLKSYFFHAISNNLTSSSDLSLFFGNLNFNDKYIAMAVSMENASSNMFSANYSIFSNILKILDKSPFTVIPFFDISQMTFLFAMDPSMSDREVSMAVLKLANAIYEYLNYNTSIRYVIGIGECISSLKNVMYSYNGAVSALNYSFYLGFNTVICISDMEPTHDSVDYCNFYANGFLDYIKVGNSQMALSLIKELFDSFRDNQEKIEIVQRICNEVVVHLSMCLVQCGQNPDVLFNKTDVWAVLRKYSTVDSLEKYISDIAEVTISHITFSRSTKNKSLIKNVQNYIQLNPAVSLNDISAHFYHSPNYLSNIFSKEVGITIKNYIINTRIDRAKQLLTETEESIYEIANAVGYKDPQYFSVLFKKKVGVTPSAYKLSGPV